MDVALIGLVGVVLGVLASNLVSRIVEIQRRRERTKDIVTAVHAEITASLRGAQLQTNAVEREYILANETPFGVADDTDFVFRALSGGLDDLSILPLEVIHSVVAYYKVAQQTNLMTAALEKPLFAQQKPEERRKFLGELLDITAEQVRLGNLALAALEEFGERHNLGLADKRVALQTAVSNQRPDGSTHARSPSPRNIGPAARD